MKPCPSCQFLSPPEAQVCNFCGHDFEQARIDAEIEATRLAGEGAARQRAAAAQAAGVGHFSGKPTRVPRPGEEHLEEPVSRTVVAVLALVALVLLIGVGWWVTRSHADSPTTPTVTIPAYIPPTTTVVEYAQLTTQPPTTTAAPCKKKSCKPATTTTTPTTTVAPAPTLVDSPKGLSPG